MIAEPYILAWREQFPWSRMQFVEQDLLISRAVVAIYSDPWLAERLAWRGGTALNCAHCTAFLDDGLRRGDRIALNSRSFDQFSGDI